MKSLAGIIQINDVDANDDTWTSGDIDVKDANFAAIYVRAANGQDPHTNHVFTLCISGISESEESFLPIETTKKVLGIGAMAMDISDQAFISVIESIPEGEASSVDILINLYMNGH